jgi:hypothetical protein
MSIQSGTVDFNLIGVNFNNNGFDHLARAMGAGAVTDTTLTATPLPYGSWITVLAKVGDEYIAASCQPTGKILGVTPQSIWPDLDAEVNTKVHQVKFITRPCKVPPALALQGVTEDLHKYTFLHG